jgi:cytochrome c oxidase subunit 3
MSAVLRAARGPGGGGGPDAPASLARRWARRPRACSVGLWVFMGVASTLFSLFGVAYVMRLANADAVAIAMPPQLLLSTAWLVLASVLLQGAAATSDWPERSRAWLLAGGLCSLGFLATQGWAWQALMARAVGPAGNPAASFFYLLTALHALHLAGGLAGWALAARAAWDTGAAPVAAWRITLCARYWHFLLLVWLALYAGFTWITPEVARVICRTA